MAILIERTISSAIRVSIPKQEVEPDFGFEECCYRNIVLASSSSDDADKNDYNGFYAVKQSSGDTVTYWVEKGVDEWEVGAEDLGEVYNYGDLSEQPGLSYVVVDWKKVIEAHGEGCYKVRIDQNVAGVDVSIYSNSYHLEEYSDVAADRTVRFDAYMDRKIVHKGVNFGGTGFKTTLRLSGFFGNRQPKYEVDNTIKRNYKPEQIVISEDSEYIFGSKRLPECITKELFDFILFSNDLRVNDYNSNNHSYFYKDFPVVLSKKVTANYKAQTRKARIEVSFNDGLKNKRTINC